MNWAPAQLKWQQQQTIAASTTSERKSYRKIIFISCPRTRVELPNQELSSVLDRRSWLSVVLAHCSRSDSHVSREKVRAFVSIVQ
jgi:hypothetical protein